MIYVDNLTKLLCHIDANNIIYIDGTIVECEEYKLRDTCYITPLQDYINREFFNSINTTTESIAVHNITIALKLANVSEIVDVYNLIPLKKEKLTALQSDFNKNKIFTIQETGIKLEITHETKERDMFIKVLTEALNLSQEDDDGIIRVYQQEINNIIYKISAVNTVWKNVFRDLFYVNREIDINGQKVLTRLGIRDYNSTKKNEIESKIKNAKTLTELNAVSWQFIPHPIIDVDNKATELMGSNISEDVKILISAKKGSDGKYHLIDVINTM